MSTSFWLPSDTSAAVSPTPDAADWGHVNSVSRKLNTVPGGSALTTLAYAPDVGDHLAQTWAMYAQFVSDILPPQTISAQLVGVQNFCLEDNALNNTLLAFKVYAVSILGTVVLAPIVPRSVVGAELTAASLRGRGGAIVSTAAILATVFRLVLEIGTGHSSTPGAGGGNHNGSLQFGDLYDGAGVNISGTTAGCPKLEFTTGLTFATLPDVADVRLGTTYGAPASLLTGALDASASVAVTSRRR